MRPRMERETEKEFFDRTYCMDCPMWKETWSGAAGRCTKKNMETPMLYYCTAKPSDTELHDLFNSLSYVYVAYRRDGRVTGLYPRLRDAAKATGISASLIGEEIRNHGYCIRKDILIKKI